MWYWDFIPSGNNHKKKPLTKAQLQKIREAYAQADAITEHVKKLENAEKEKKEKELEKSLNSLFL